MGAGGRSPYPRWGVGGRTSSVKGARDDVPRYQCPVRSHPNIWGTPAPPRAKVPVPWFRYGRDASCSTGPGTSAAGSPLSWWSRRRQTRALTRPPTRALVLEALQGFQKALQALETRVEDVPEAVACLKEVEKLGIRVHSIDKRFAALDESVETRMAQLTRSVNGAHAAISQGGRRGQSREDAALGQRIREALQTDEGKKQLIAEIQQSLGATQNGVPDPHEAGIVGAR